MSVANSVRYRTVRNNNARPSLARPGGQMKFRCEPCGDSGWLCDDHPEWTTCSGIASHVAALDLLVRYATQELRRSPRIPAVMSQARLSTESKRTPSLCGCGGGLLAGRGAGVRFAHSRRFWPAAGKAEFDPKRHCGGCFERAARWCQEDKGGPAVVVTSVFLYSERRASAN